MARSNLARIIDRSMRRPAPADAWPTQAELDERFSVHTEIRDPEMVSKIIAIFVILFAYAAKKRRLYSVAYRMPNGEAEFVYLNALDYADAWLRVMLCSSSGTIPKGAKVDVIGEVVGRETYSGVIV